MHVRRLTPGLAPAALSNANEEHLAHVASLACRVKSQSVPPLADRAEALSPPQRACGFGAAYTDGRRTRTASRFDQFALIARHL